MEVKGKYPLLSKWSLWETFQADMTSSKKVGADSYKSNISKICSFDTLDDFAIIWNNLPHAEPAQFFFQKSMNIIKKLKHDGNFKSLESVSFFRGDIEPTWEDPCNKAGGDYTIRVDNMDTEDINEFWKNFVFDIIGESFPMTDRINGFRVVDKSKAPNMTTRFEIWVKFKSSNKDKTVMEEKIKEYFDNASTIKKGGYYLDFKDH